MSNSSTVVLQHEGSDTSDARLQLRPSAIPLSQSPPCHKLKVSIPVEAPNLHTQVADKPPALYHKVKNERSILALSIFDGKIYAGTQGGEILVWSLGTFDLLGKIFAHRGAVLALHTCENGNLLFSSGGDAFVNVWSTSSLRRLYSIYSTFDVGDVFCVAYSSRLETVYLGAQNTSIQWYNLAHKDDRPAPNLAQHPLHRTHRFFDSKGPGGTSTPRSSDATEYFEQEGTKLEIQKSDILQYAHYGYVYCMMLEKGPEWAGTSDEILITGGGDGSVRFWALDASTGAISLLDERNNGDDSVLTMALNGSFLYTGKLEGHVDVWDLNTKQLIQSVPVYNADVLTVQAAHGLMFTGGTSGKVKVLERYKTKQEWEAHEQLILASAMASHHEKEFLVTGGNDDCVAIWDISNLTNGPLTPQRASNEDLIDALGRFVSFKSVSSRREYTEDCRQAASFLKRLLERRGASPRLLSTDDARNPVVYGRFKGKRSDKCTLFYGHYDVVLAENRSKQWISDPFTLYGQDSYLYGRGVSDNKGPLLAAIFAAADLASENRLDHDIVFLIEGEEECGSRGFQDAVKRNKSLIGHIDHIILANSYWLTDTIPCLTYGLRGVVHATVHVESARDDLHSGVSGSRLVSEPLKDLTTILSRLSGPDNRILLPGFYDKILSITNNEERLFSHISKLLGKSNIADGMIEMTPDALKAKWREPSLTIHSFTTSGSSSATVIPHRAKAAISLRLVPDQDALEVQKALVDHLRDEFDRLVSTNTLRIETANPADPWQGNPQNEIYQTLERAVIEVWRMDQISDPSGLSDTASDSETASQPPNGPKRSAMLPRIANIKANRPLYIREGGSIPAVRFLEKELGAPAAQLPCGQASDNAHLDNERLGVMNLYNSRKIFRRVFKELGGQH